MEFDPPASSDGMGQTQIKPAKRASAPRPAKALPTDRLKFDAQVDALRAFVIESNNGQRAVTSADIAPHIGVVEATASLNNAFFMEAGLISREKKGSYKPTKPTIDYAQNLGFDPDAAKATLGTQLSTTWFYEAVKAMGNSETEKVVGVLANKAGAMVVHRPKLDALLEWLEYTGLIKLIGNKVILGDAPAAPAEPVEPVVTPTGQPPSQAWARPDPSDGARPTKDGSVVLEFNFSCSLTATDLAELDPEQITALYSAVGGVMAAQAALNSKKK
jgi:hypothetical protein